jgi:hypothetical protein
MAVCDAPTLGFDPMICLCLVQYGRLTVLIATERSIVFSELLMADEMVW